MSRWKFVVIAVSCVSACSGSKGTESQRADGGSSQMGSGGRDGGTNVGPSGGVNSAGTSSGGTNTGGASNECGKVPEKSLTQVTTSTSGQVLGLQVVGSLLYFSDSRGVWSVPVSGGTPIAVVSLSAADNIEMGRFVIAATHVVWTDKAFSAFKPTLHARLLSGGVTTDLASDSLDVVEGLAATDASAFPAVFGASNLLSIPVDGGPATTLATNADVDALLVVGNTLYFTNGFSGTPGNALLAVPVGGGTPTPLTDIGLSGGGPMSTDGRNLYFGGNLNGQNFISAYPLAGGSVATVVATSADIPAFTSGQGRVFYAQTSGCSTSPVTYEVREVGADKANPKVDLLGILQVNAMTADSSSVYVATQVNLVSAATIGRFAL